MQAAADAWAAADAAVAAAAAAPAAAAEGAAAADEAGGPTRRKQLREPRPWQDLGSEVGSCLLVDLRISLCLQAHLRNPLVETACLALYVVVR